MEECFYRLYSSLPQVPFAQKVARIDLDALQSNYRALLGHVRKSAPNVRAIAVVKADAYGHGAPDCVRALLGEGCDFFAVSSVEEAVAVREACDGANKDAEILILGYTDPRHACLLDRYRLTQTLVSFAHACALQNSAREAGVRLRTHVALDTGMGRIGFAARSEEEIRGTAREILSLFAYPNLSVDGMFTHFARADEESEAGVRFTKEQSENYLAVRRLVEDGGKRIPFYHASNSAASIKGVAAGLDGVRFGIVMYGASPSLHGELPLLPVMTLETRIVHIHQLKKGETVGYGGTFCAPSDMTVGVLPIGYADGFVRAYSPAPVCVRTATGVFSAPILGRVCMDQCMIDLSSSDACVGDTVILFGKDGPLAEALARQAGTIDYETLCLISSRVPRFYRGGSYDRRL
ncbi:MAG: alanine racemase [Clostridia bacterium]|nr:alanine racemase [Clostridia bacterium]